MNVPETLTRGERNANPGNLDRTAERWADMAEDQSSDRRFVVFKTPEDGIRALAKVVLTYHRKHGLDTIQGIIGRWAPPNENETIAYIKHVAEQLGVSPNEVIEVTDPEVLEVIVRAIIRHENGRVIYSDATIVSAIDRALA